MTHLRPFRACAALALALVAAGCYSYEPVTEPAPGTTVRVGVPVSSPVAGRHDAPEVISVEGRLLAAGDTLLVETRSRREYGAFREVLELDTLRVAQDNVALVEERLLSKPKTYGFTALVTGGAVWLGVAALNTLTGEAGGGKDGGGDPVSQQIVLTPIFSALAKLFGR